MKKFLLVVTLVGVVISQIFFSSQAEAFNEGDVLEVFFYRCVSHRPLAGCGRIFRLIKDSNGNVLVDERDEQNHLLESFQRKLYRYNNGQWVEIYCHSY